VENFTAANITMENVAHPFVITTFYMGKDKPGDQFEVNDGTPRFHNFLFNNITAVGAADAGSVTGLRELPVEDILFSHVRITSETGFACTNACRISFEDVEINPGDGPALTLRNAAEIDSARLRSRTLAPGTELVRTVGGDATMPQSK
jgi:hypothetical protein